MPLDPSIIAGAIKAFPDILNIQFGFIRDIFGISSKEEKMQNAVLQAQKDMLGMQLNAAIEMDKEKTVRQRNSLEFWNDNLLYVTGGVVAIGFAIAASKD